MIYLILLITLLINYVFKTKPSNYLYCGIWAWNGKSPKTFKQIKFDVLGSFNDARGGDACGMYINNTTLKSISPSEFQDLAISRNSKGSNIEVESNVVIGHARKASVGINTISNAQPIQYNIEDKKVILAHNGTIYNYEELCDEYDVEIMHDVLGNGNKTRKSDSWVLAELIGKYGFDILTEYEGTCAFVYHESDNPETMYVFKGESLLSTHSSILKEERPLYFYNENKNSLYVSSLKNALNFIGAKTEDVVDFKSNTVYKIKNGVAKIHKIIDRSKSYQKKVITYSTKDDGLDDDWYKTSAQKALVAESSYIANRNKEKKSDGHLYSPEKATNDKSIFEHFITNINNEKAVYNEGTNNKLYYCKGRYWNHHSLANGCIRLNQYGVPCSKPSGKAFYFIDGIMIKDHTSHKKASKLWKGSKYLSELNRLPEIVEYATYPIQELLSSTNINNSSQNIMYGTEGRIVLVANCVYTPLFSYKKYTIKKGKLSHIEILRNMTDQYDDENKHLPKPLNVENVQSEEMEDCFICGTSGYVGNMLCNNCDGEGYVKLTPTRGSEDKSITEESEEVFDYNQAKLFDEELIYNETSKEIDIIIGNLMTQIISAKDNLSILDDSGSKSKVAHEKLDELEVELVNFTNSSQYV